MGIAWPSAYSRAVSLVSFRIYDFQNQHQIRVRVYKNGLKFLIEAPVPTLNLNDKHRMAKADERVMFILYLPLPAEKYAQQCR